MQVLKNHSPEYYDTHLLTKALLILSRYHCHSWRQTKLLYFSGVLESVSQIMSYGEMSTTREAATLCTKIMQNPDGMILWLKFDSPLLRINSACTEDFIL